MHHRVGHLNAGGIAVEKQPADFCLQHADQFLSVGRSSSVPWIVE